MARTLNVYFDREIVGKLTQDDFFGGTLPEEGSRKIIARILGISDRNDFAMLEQIRRSACRLKSSINPRAGPVFAIVSLS